MTKDRHYVIGDIHGEYQMLLMLVEKIPTNGKLIFVGDLVNRGKGSRQVIEFVRKNAFKVVKGNHEKYMLKHANIFLKFIERYQNCKSSNIWLYRECSEVFRSYGLLKEKSAEIIINPKGIFNLKRDLRWISTLPLYYELGEVDNYSLPVVISHGSIGDFWHLKDTDRIIFDFHILKNRIEPSYLSPIFNIYGHESVSDIVVGDNFISLDTGCGKYQNGKLTAYCIETGEVLEVKKCEIEIEKERVA
jgi:serine/threonine protein phosphatase 1